MGLAWSILSLSGFLVMVLFRNAGLIGLSGLELLP